MNLKKIRACLTACCTVCCLLVLHSAHGRAQQNSPASPKAAKPASAEHDGQHDFDFEIGTWKIHLNKLEHTLAGSHDPSAKEPKKWLAFDGDSVTKKIWDGRAQIEQFETEGAAGHIEGLTLRLYNPQTHEWRLYWANAKNGYLDQPMIGEFKDGVGEFYDQEPFNGRMIYVRFIWSRTGTSSPHFEQSYSDDGGKTWEVNWITDQTRVQAESEKER